MLTFLQREPLTPRKNYLSAVPAARIKRQFDGKLIGGRLAQAVSAPTKFGQVLHCQICYATRLTWYVFSCVKHHFFF
jgi:hypothetical protein